MKGVDLPLGISVLAILDGLIEEYAFTAEVPAARDAVAELIQAVQPFARINSSESTTNISVSSGHIDRLRAALARMAVVA